MSKISEFSFGDSSVANSYDNVLVPILFAPWADKLIEENQPWVGKHVLDLATGTGVMAERLVKQVGSSGKVFAVDICSEMLAKAKSRCNGGTTQVTFIESSAQALDIQDDSIDFVVCQQGFQFFPDRDIASKEIYRVLKKGGKTIITTWCPVDECDFFGAICNALSKIGESKISDMMRIPFNIMPDTELKKHFETNKFVNVQLQQHEQDLIIEGGVEYAVKVSYATPIGPKLHKLPDNKRDEFAKIFKELLKELTIDGKTMGRMVSNHLSADK